MIDEILEGSEPFRYVPNDDPASHEGFARKHLTDPPETRISERAEVVKPDIGSFESFEAPIDLLILALGVRGNYANVMPGTQQNTGWHVAHLSSEFRQAHAQSGSESYEGAHFREYGMSLGPEQVKAAGQVVVIASGEKKRALAEQLLWLEVFNSEFPLSIIYHPEVRDRVQIFLTEDVGI